MPEEKSCSTCVFDTVSRTSTVCATCESGAAYLHWRPKGKGTIPSVERPGCFGAYLAGDCGTCAFATDCMVATKAAAAGRPGIADAETMTPREKTKIQRDTVIRAAKAAGYKLPEDMRPEVKYVFVPEYRGEEEEEEEEAAATTALDTQVGGGHYKKFTIQPAVFIEKNGLSFLEGCVVKRICRWKDKNGLEDLIKAKHEIDLLIEIHRVN